MRARAGWLAALLYLFCVLAPGAALALGGAASYPVTGIRTTAITHVHGDSSHQHPEAQGKEHSSHHADAGGSKDDHARHGHDKSAPGPCCAMLCHSAIAADLPAIAKPSQPISVYLFTDYQRLPGEAPPLLYRPPIA